MPGAGMVPHFAGLAALGTRGRGPNAVWEGLVRRNEVPFRPPHSIPAATFHSVTPFVAQSAMTIRPIFRPFDDDVHVDVS